MKSRIEEICKEKEQELLNKYFPMEFSEEETIGAYPKDLPLKVEAEFREYLTELWKGYSDEPLELEEKALRMEMTEDDREAVDNAFKDARRVTLWERITKTNHEDVIYYKGLLREYAKELLLVMRVDFLEEITGDHITGKTFEELV